MRFINNDIILSEQKILDVEKQLKLKFPLSLRNLFLNYNGGDPDPHIFQNEFEKCSVSYLLICIKSKKITLGLLFPNICKLLCISETLLLSTASVFQR